MITYVLSDILYSDQFNYLFNNKKKFNQSLSVIFINNNKKGSLLINSAKRNKIPYKSYLYNNKIDLIIIFFKIFFAYINWKSQVVHCHLRKAEFLGLLCAFILRIKKRIFTRHHGDENSFFLKGRLFDNLINFLSTEIVAISKVTYFLLKHKNYFTKKKIKLIHHGFNLNELKYSSKKRNIFRTKLGIKKNNLVIGIISRFVDWKGINHSIAAFKKFLLINNNAILLIVNLNGNCHEKIRKLIKTIPKKNIRILNFQKNIISLYSSFDIFIHVPVRRFAEAFGQVIYEAIMFNIPSIFTKSGIACEIAINNYNCFLVNYKNSENIFKILKKYTHKETKKRIIKNLKKKDFQFKLEDMIGKLNEIYEKK